jgi:hypothetical protein
VRNDSYWRQSRRFGEEKHRDDGILRLRGGVKPAHFRSCGGPIALLRDDDIIEIDAISGTVNHQVGDAELEKRRKEWRPRKINFGSGALWKYAQMVGPAVSGAVTHGGALNETNVYADI